MGGAEGMRVVACVLGVVLGQAAHPAFLGAHETPVAPLVVGSTTEGGGALRLVRTDNAPIEVTQSTTSRAVRPLHRC